MRWWLNTDHGRFSIDNAVVNGMDFSSLDPLIWMVQWQDGHGEIENQVDKDTNDNGLRETFIDVTPYAPFFQQFLSLCPRLTLTQAKKIDIDLIRQLFDSKRQAPFHYPVAAGDYWWDATDETLYSSTAAGLQNTIASLNQVIAALNSAVAHYNSNFVGIINQNAGYSNTLVAQINSNVVDPSNSAFAFINGQFSYGDALISYINYGMLGPGGDGGNNINGRLISGVQSIQISEAVTVFVTAAMPGLVSPIAYTGITFGSNPYAAQHVGPGTFNNASPAPYTSIPAVAVANAQWIPIGSTVAVNVTPAEQAAIMNGIAARTNQLNIKKNIKIGEVNAMTTVAAVIAYDVTTGW